MTSSARTHPRASSGAVRRALLACTGIFASVGLFSGVINLLALTGSFYMLQVYDRVLPSRSLPTLVGLSLLLVGLYLAYGALDFVRLRLMSRIGLRIGRELREAVFRAIQSLPLRTRGSADGLLPLRDLDQVRAFLSGVGPAALFDVPWIPVYLTVVFLLHPMLGLFATAGALLLVGLALAADVRSSAPMYRAARSGSSRLAFGEIARRNAEAARAMGLTPHLYRRWAAIDDAHAASTVAASDTASSISALSKVLRLVMQSGILGLGAYLVIGREVSPGTIIAASIVMSRALAPVETALAHWRGFVAARHSLRRLEELLSLLASEPARGLLLPPPRQSLAAKDLCVAPPGLRVPVIRGIRFELGAGDGLGIIGPSASGKSTLARALVGIWPPCDTGGSVRLDGATLDQWPADLLGRHIGYLPQDVELFAGTVAENIARFDPEATSEAIVAAGRDAGVHDVIVHLPQGYDTVIGDNGIGLSAGQRQRIALARALYGRPFLVVLDEPNSNLDAEGDAALTGAILSVRARGGIAIVIAHRPSALAGVDRVLALADGQMRGLGPKEEVLRGLLHPAAAHGALGAAAGRHPATPAGSAGYAASVEPVGGGHP